MDAHVNIDEEQVLQELRRIVNSDEFRSAKRLKEFLTYAVFETLAGRERNLSGYAIGIEVFGRGEDFDPQTNTLVRVTANKLRLKLDHYYNNAGRNNPLRLRLPLGAYRVSVERRAMAQPPRGDRHHPVMAIESFDCLSQAAEHKDFCKGFLSEVCLALADADQFMLAPLGAAGKRGHNGALGAKNVEEEHDADFLLGCNLRWTGSRLRVYAQLVEARTRYVLWIDSRELPWNDRDLLDIQAEAASFIAQGVLRADRVASNDRSTDPSERGSEPTSVH
ncbi:MAG: hypothetical protein H6959_08290 [Chromatiaceae bacterium]|nr:hypothetical protein [Chromatiaceae bacterium]